MSISPISIAQVTVCLFFGVLFTQSGIDKVVDWKGNLGWLNGHFSKTPFRGLVPLLLGVVTLVEIAAGALSLIGAAALFFSNKDFAMMGLATSAIALLMLFAGQRIAKDYPGAATLATYFGVALFGLYLLSL